METLLDLMFAILAALEWLHELELGKLPPLAKCFSAKPIHLEFLLHFANLTSTHGMGAGKI